MKVLLKDGLLVLIGETDGEGVDLAAWNGSHRNHVLSVLDDPGTAGKSIVLRSLGERAQACREPINVVSNSTDPAARLISNFAETPFVLDGQDYLTVESFWQGLKFPLEHDRKRIARLAGSAARDEGERQGYGSSVTYDGTAVNVGTWAHWQLMARACRAKFEQHDEARTALISTGARPLVHIVRRDSRTIPGVIMASIWMRIRRKINDAAKS